jgi:hypothetical protein
MSKNPLAFAAHWDPSTDTTALHFRSSMGKFMGEN